MLKVCAEKYTLFLPVLSMLAVPAGNRRECTAGGAGIRPWHDAGLSPDDIIGDGFLSVLFKEGDIGKMSGLNEAAALRGNIEEAAATGPSSSNAGSRARGAQRENFIVSMVPEPLPKTTTP